MIEAVGDHKYMTPKQKTEIQEAITNSLREVLKSDKVDAPLLIQRVPFICEDIKGINSKLGGMTTYIEGDKKWKVDDANWKKEFDLWKTSIVEPLVKEKGDERTIKQWQLKELKMLAAITGAAVSLYLMLHYWGFLINIHI